LVMEEMCFVLVNEVFFELVCVCGCVVYLLFCVMVENGEEEEKSEGTFELVKKKKNGFLVVVNVVFVDFGWLEMLVLGR